MIQVLYVVHIALASRVVMMMMMMMMMKDQAQ